MVAKAKNVVSADAAEALVLSGRRIRAVREAAGMTQDEVCELLGLKQSTYSRWESGERQPDWLIMRAFAARFKTSFDFLIRGLPIGMHPNLLECLREHHPELLASYARNRDLGMDTNQAAYRRGISAGQTEQTGQNGYPQ